MEDLFDEEELDDVEVSGEDEDAIKRKERVVKPEIIIQLTETIRIVLMSDRRNMQVQTKSDDPEKVTTDETEEHVGWKFRGYYGTRNWKGILEKAYSLAKEERLGKKVINETEDLKQAIHSTTSEIKKWAKEITDTLINNKINL